MSNLFALITTFIIQSSAETCDFDDISSYFTYPIHDLQSAQIQSLITNAIQQLDTNHYFYIPNFLASQAIEFFAQSLLANNTVRAASLDKYRTVFQDNGDENYPPNHPRNLKTWSSSLFVGRSDLESSPANSKIIDLYQYPPLLQFFKAIVTKSTETPYNDLHLSKDPEGSIYSLIFRDHEVGSWHLDEHPFSCVWTVQQPLFASGAFGYVYLPPVTNEDGSESWPDYDIIGKVIRNDTNAWKEHVRYHMVKEGEIYCFNGNITMHMMNMVVGDVERVNFVTAYSEDEHFKHKDSINEFNVWGKHNPELHKDASV